MDIVQKSRIWSAEGLSWAPLGITGAAAALILVLTWFFTASPLFGILGALAVVGGALIWIFPQQSLLLLVGSLFLESEVFSITLPWGRVRIFHVISAILVVRALFDLLTGRVKLRRTPLDIPLLAFIGVGVIALPLAPDLLYAVKILGLTILLALLYWLIIHYVRAIKLARKVTSWFIAFGVLQILIGIGQVVLAYIDARYGPLGFDITVFHSDILPFGRPYGTFVEPDWFGAITGALLAIIAVRVFDKNEKHQLGWLGLALFAGGALVLSGVRGAWLGAVASFVYIFFVNRKRGWLNLRAVPVILVSVGVTLALLALALPELAASLSQRFLSLGSVSAVSDEPRLAIMQEGVEIWLRSPWLGHGPGGFGTLGTVPSIPKIDAFIQGLVPFQTNIIINVLVDAGVAGLAIAGWLLVRLVKTVRHGLAQVPKQLCATLLGLSAALVGLFVTYQVTTGAWLALTWFVVGLTVSISMIKKEESV